MRARYDAVLSHSLPSHVGSGIEKARGFFGDNFCGLRLQGNIPDLPFLAFWDFPAFFIVRNFLAFWSVFPFFPGILGVRHREKSLLFWVVFLAFFQKGRSGIGSSQTWLFQTWLFAIFYEEALFCAHLRPFALFSDPLRTCACALLRTFEFFCVHLRVSASDRV